MDIYKRGVAFFIDLGIYIVSLAVLGILGITLEDTIFDEKTEAFIMFGILLGIFAMVFMFFFKDLIGGQSVGKRIMKLKVYGKDGKEAKKSQLFLRGLTTFILPIEIICVACLKERLGDKLAKTKVDMK